MEDDAHGAKVEGVDPSHASIFAATDAAAPHKLTIGAINKSTKIMNTELNVRGGTRYKSATVYHVVQGSPEIVGSGSRPVSNNSTSLTLPAMSVSTIVETD